MVMGSSGVLGCLVSLNLVARMLYEAAELLHEASQQCASQRTWRFSPLGIERLSLGSDGLDVRVLILGSTMDWWSEKC